MIALRQTRLGRALSGLAANGPDVEMCGERSWFINQLIACHVLTEMSYATILADAALMRFVEHNTAREGSASPPGSAKSAFSRRPGASPGWTHTNEQTQRSFMRLPSITG
jgi:hypothetical protein